MRTQRIACGLLAALALAGVLPAQQPNARAWNVRHSPIIDVVKRVKDSVVNIHSERLARAGATEEFFALAPSQNRVNGMGTGIVIDPRGYIITNQHVVDEVSSLRVRLADGTTVAARIIGRDPENDLALLKIAPDKPLPAMPLGTAKDVEVGETTVAIGNAYGYDHTVTSGIVSAIGRDVTLNKEVRYKSLIQTDAAINPGNSGGPLVNLEGQLIGVNVAIRAGAQGIGFAIPVDTMIRIAGQMMAADRARQGVGGAGLALRDDVASSAASRKVVVERAEGASAKAGLREGDVLVRAGGRAVSSSLDLHRALVDLDAGKAVALVVRRDGKDKAIDLALDATDARPALPAPAGGTPAWRKLGLRVEPLGNPAEAVRGHPKLNGGLHIAEVRPDSPASKAGLRRGDILIGLHQWEMLTADNVAYVLNHPDRSTFNPLQFYILRGSQVHRGWLAISE
ncbi:MAG: trypsin-like peptidase domain-containing protein [Gemmataceae bacterium]|nr:trypsin-like peptidase domain-containing protein [Gemmataceae bacterium]